MICLEDRRRTFTQGYVVVKSLNVCQRLIGHGVCFHFLFKKLLHPLSLHIFPLLLLSFDLSYQFLSFSLLLELRLFDFSPVATVLLLQIGVILRKSFPLFVRIHTCQVSPLIHFYSLILPPVIRVFLSSCLFNLW